MSEQHRPTWMRRVASHHHDPGVICADNCHGMTGEPCPPWCIVGGTAEGRRLHSIPSDMRGRRARFRRWLASL